MVKGTGKVMATIAKPTEGIISSNMNMHVIMMAVPDNRTHKKEIK